MVWVSIENIHTHTHTQTELLIALIYRFSVIYYSSKQNKAKSFLAIKITYPSKSAVERNYWSWLYIKKIFLGYPAYGIITINS